MVTAVMASVAVKSTMKPTTQKPTIAGFTSGNRLVKGFSMATYIVLSFIVCRQSNLT